MWHCLQTALWSFISVAWQLCPSLTTSAYQRVLSPGSIQSVGHCFCFLKPPPIHLSIRPSILPSIHPSFIHPLSPFIRHSLKGSFTAYLSFSLLRIFAGWRNGNVDVCGCLSSSSIFIKTWVPWGHSSWAHLCLWDLEECLVHRGCCGHAWKSEWIACCVCSMRRIFHSPF